MKKGQVYKVLAQRIAAMRACNQEWSEKHLERIEEIQKEFLPSGSGFDMGTKIEIQNCSKDQLVFTFNYHHMNENGFYTKWTGHTVRIKPSFVYDFEMSITKNRIDEHTLDYFHETFDYFLRQEIEF